VFQFVLVIHLLLCVALIAIILKQQGKGADMGAAFGSAGGSNTVFGSAGMGNVLVKMTVGAAVIFMITSIILAKGHTEFAVRGGTVDDPARGTIFDRMIDEPAPPAGEAAAPAAEGDDVTVPVEQEIDTEDAANDAVAEDQTTTSEDDMDSPADNAAAN